MRTPADSLKDHEMELQQLNYTVIESKTLRINYAIRLSLWVCLSVSLSECLTVPVSLCGAWAKWYRDTDTHLTKVLKMHFTVLGLTEENAWMNERKGALKKTCELWRHIHKDRWALMSLTQTGELWHQKHRQVTFDITEIQTGELWYHRNTDRWALTSQKHRQVSSDITETQTGELWCHRNTDRWALTSQKHRHMWVLMSDTGEFWCHRHCGELWGQTHKHWWVLMSQTGDTIQT